MINVSNSFRQELINNRKNYQLTVNITLSDDTVLTLDNSNIMFNGFNMDDAVSDDNSFDALGGCVINSATLVINNRDDSFSSYDFQNAIVVVYLQLLNEQIKKGTFIVDSPSYDGFSITLNCLDCMVNFDRSYSLSNLTYPVTLSDIVLDACSVCGVTLATSSLNFPHKNYVINNAPNDETTTFRDVLSWVATIAGCFARCNVDGELELKWFDTETLEDYLSDPDNTDIFQITSLFSQTVGVEDVVITGVRAVTVADDNSDNVSTEYMSGQSGYVISIEDNKFITATNIQEIVTWLGTQLIGVRFRQLSITHPNDPTIEAGDVAVVIDRKSNEYPILITRTAFSVSSTQTTVCGAESVSKNSSVQYSQATKNYVESRKQLVRVKSSLETEIENASGLYKTEVTEQGATKIYYHDKQDLEDSSIIMLFSTAGFTVSADGGTTWYGLTVDGNLITSILNTTGINADWINTGEFVVTKTEGTTTTEIFYANVDTGVVRIKNMIITDNGIDITDGSNVVASFGENTQIGEDGNSRLRMDYHSLELIDGQGGSYFYVSDLRNKNGIATIKQIFKGNGTDTVFNLSYTATDNNYTVSVHDGSGGTITKTTTSVSFSTAPTNGILITCIYETEAAVKAYTLGSRDPLSTVGPYSVVIGQHGEASGNYSYAEGYSTNAQGFSTHAEGTGTTASAEYAHAEGHNSTASGVNSHAEGSACTASGADSHAEGGSTTASKTASHAEGYDTTASGDYSHAEGYNTTASSPSSHAEGHDTVASGWYSHAQNDGTIAASDDQTALGRFNVKDSTNQIAVIVGNGTANNARSNALTLKWNGDLKTAGEIEDGNGTSISDVLANFSNFFIIKEYPYAYSNLNPGAGLNISATDFGFSRPTGYVPIAVVRATSGTLNVAVIGTNVKATGSGAAMTIYNHSNAARSYTATITVLYARSSMVNDLT